MCGRAARESLERAGCTLKLVYFNTRGLRAHLKPEKFDILPRTYGVPPPYKADKYDNDTAESVRVPANRVLKPKPKFTELELQTKRYRFAGKFYSLADLLQLQKPAGADTALELPPHLQAIKDAKIAAKDAKKKQKAAAAESASTGEEATQTQ